ncbi:MAG: hypothetical protein ACR2MX_04990 [Cyclobacteriaceae bacterium]
MDLYSISVTWSRHWKIFVHNITWLFQYPINFSINWVTTMYFRHKSYPSFHGMSESKKSNGVIKPIIVGVATTVLTSMILFHLGLDRKGGAAETDQSSSPGGIRLISESSTNLAEVDVVDEIAAEAYSEPPEVKSPIIDINGYWVDPQTQATYHIQQQGAHFTFQEISYGSVSAEGQGNLQGNSAVYNYATLMGTQGNGSFKIDATGRSITSTFTDHYTGVTQTIFMQRE